jgi:hypothetical protein
MDGKHCPAEEWVKEHLTGCMSADDLRESLGLPKDGDYQAIFSGTIHGETDYWGEYDEDMDIDADVKFEAIPAGWLKRNDDPCPDTDYRGDR